MVRVTRQPPRVYKHAGGRHRHEETLMTKIDRLQRMIDDIRRMREDCEPKNNGNPRYHKYSSAVSNLKWIIEDLQIERALS
jgi:hypothetical protein